MKIFVVLYFCFKIIIEIRKTKETWNNAMKSLVSLVDDEFFIEVEISYPTGMIILSGVKNIIKP